MVNGKCALLCLVREVMRTGDKKKKNDPGTKTGVRVGTAMVSSKRQDLKGFSLSFGNRN